jgi:hypothetical protein
MASSIKTVSHATPHPRYVRVPGLPHDPDERFPGRAGLLSRPRCEAGDFPISRIVMEAMSMPARAV